MRSLFSLSTRKKNAISDKLSQCTIIGYAQPISDVRANNNGEKTHSKCIKNRFPAGAYGFPHILILVAMCEKKIEHCFQGMQPKHECRRVVQRFSLSPPHVLKFSNPLRCCLNSILSILVSKKTIVFRLDAEWAMFNVYFAYIALPTS